MVRYVARTPPEGVNLPERHPLADFAILLAAVAAAIAALSLAAAWAAGRWARGLSDQREAALASWLPDDAFATANGPRPDAVRALQERADALAGPGALPYRTGILCERAANAFAIPGRRVRVTSGLIRLVRSQNELDMVLGHEIAHIEARDHVAGLARRLAVAVPVSIVSDAAAGRVLGGVSTLFELGFTREQERAADLRGLALVHARYRHVAGAADLFRRLKDVGAGPEAAVPEFLRTHPLEHSRIEALAAAARERGWPEAGALAPLPEALRRPCR